jgi:hypothetical protein
MKVVPSLPFDDTGFSHVSRPWSHSLCSFKLCHSLNAPTHIFSQIYILQRKTFACVEWFSLSNKFLMYSSYVMAAYFSHSRCIQIFMYDRESQEALTLRQSQYKVWPLFITTLTTVVTLSFTANLNVNIQFKYSGSLHEQTWNILLTSTVQTAQILIYILLCSLLADTISVTYYIASNGRAIGELMNWKGCGKKQS